MERTIKNMLAVALLLFTAKAYCQGTGAHEPVKKTATGASIAVELKNLDEKDVMIFTGRRDELRNPKPKQKQYGGLSTNTIYASVNEVVCIINPQEKPAACVNVRPGITKIEVNSSGTAMSVK